MPFDRSQLRSLLACAALAAATLLAACDDSATTPPKGLDAPALAILSSDYKTSTVSLYDPSTRRLVDDCIAAKDLSKDTVLPSSAQAGELVVVDRDQSMIDFVSPADCLVRGKLSVSTGGFKANPHDIVRVSSTKAYVTRYNKNAAATPAPGDFDDGDDVLIVDPTGLKVTGRIDLSAQASTVGGVVLDARPDRALLANGLVYVTLNNLSDDFVTAGPGRVAIIDPATDTVKGVVELPGQTGCEGISYDDATKHLFVSCGGEFSDADEAATSALVEIDISGATPVLGKIVTGKTLGTGMQPVTYTAAALLGTTAFVGTAGALDPTSGAMTAPDTLFAVATDTGAGAKVVDGGAYNLGRPAVDATSMTLFLPDGDPMTPHVRVFDVSGAPAEGTAFEANPTDHLPPREVAWY